MPLRARTAIRDRGPMSRKCAACDDVVGGIRGYDMEYRHLLSLAVLGLLWGASFLFMRVAVPEFGAVVLMTVRVALAAAVLMPLLLHRRQFRQVLQHWPSIVLIDPEGNFVGRDSGEFKAEQIAPVLRGAERRGGGAPVDS